MNPAVLVGVGGVLGAVARYLLSIRIEDGVRHTLAVNVLGSFALGALTTASVDDPTLLVFGAGFCGAFTTFSTFAVETVREYEAGERRTAVANAAVSLVGALLAVWAGALLMELLA